MQPTHFTVPDIVFRPPSALSISDATLVTENGVMAQIRVRGCLKRACLGMCLQGILRCQHDALHCFGGQTHMRTATLVKCM